ncbi:FAD binding domain protein [Aspergillus flavus]|nr:FAD binding domain protein [Aspergillus flavus]
MGSRSNYVDVLIIGAGPAGLTAANCFLGSRLNVRIIDKKNGIVEAGKADGLKSISLEVLDSFGIGDGIRNEAHRVEEITLWNSDPAGGLSRACIIPDRIPELGKPREVSLHQGRIEHHMIENLRKRSTIEVEWRKQPVHMDIDLDQVDNPEAYPITVSVETSEDGSDPGLLWQPMHAERDSIRRPEIVKETIHAKYVLGCDGARSWIRQRLGVSFIGDLTDSTWGVMDIVPKTSFPDIRKVAVIHSSKGTVMSVPREDKLVRFYIQIDAVNPNAASGLARRDLKVEDLLDAARAIMFPYTMEAAECAWWSAYRVGQRVANEFARHDRIFLAGDSVHTHSPKAGQGMNTSIQDVSKAYNIGWKLRACAEHHCGREILATYEGERKPVAEALINFDRDYLKHFAKQHASNHAEFLDAYLKGQRFTTGIGIRYPPSLLISEDVDVRSLHGGLVPGLRLPDFQVVNQSDGVPIRIHQRLRADGKFRIVVFPGDVSQEHAMSRLNQFGAWLARSQLDVEVSHSDGGSEEFFIETITVHAARRADVELEDFHEALHPWSSRWGWNYWNIYADDESYHDGHGEAYQRCGLGRNHDCVVVVRPDGYISVVCELENTGAITSFFDALQPIKSVRPRL